MTQSEAERPRPRGATPGALFPTGARVRQRGTRMTGRVVKVVYGTDRVVVKWDAGFLMGVHTKHLEAE